MKTQSQFQNQIQTPWWKQRWPWLLMSGPFVAMVGCGITIWLAFSHIDTPINEGVVQRGLKVEISKSYPEKSKSEHPAEVH